jgi:hypothetical protein
MTDIPQPQGRRLDSWKEIAEYLGRNQRTAMRWADSDGLPVRRIGNTKRRAVFAYPSEIDDWLARQALATAPRVEETPDVIPVAAADPSRAPGQMRWLVGSLALLASVAALTLVAVKLRASSPSLVTARLDGAILAGFDGLGIERFRVTVPPQPGLVSERAVRVADLDGDGRGEVIATLRTQGPSGHGQGFVEAFDQSGRVRWKATLNDRQTFGATEYGPAWYPDDMITFGAGAATRIAVAFHHHTWWPDIVSMFDAKGRRVGRFVNQGWIYDLNMTEDRKFLLAAGVSNAFGGSILAVLDADHIDGSSPEEGGVLPHCRDCPAGAPRAYIVVPWTDVARPADSPQPAVQVFPSGQIELQSSQRIDSSRAATIVTLSPSFEVVSHGVSDAYAETHARLEREGLLDHTAAACPSVRAPIRIWTPEGGWRDAK